VPSLWRVPLFGPEEEGTPIERLIRAARSDNSGESDDASDDAKEQEKDEEDDDLASEADLRPRS
jgi:hypothetical protein